MEAMTDRRERTAILRIGEAAELVLGTSAGGARATLRALCDERGIKPIRMGTRGDRFYRRSDLEALVAGEYEDAIDA